MRKIVPLIFLTLCITYSNSIYAMSDKLYKQCLQQNDFNSADTLMTKNWKRLKQLLGEEDFKFVLADQRKWVKMAGKKKQNTSKAITGI